MARLGMTSNGTSSEQENQSGKRDMRRIRNMCTQRQEENKIRKRERKETRQK